MRSEKLAILFAGIALAGSLQAALVDVNFDSAALGVYSNLSIYPASTFGASGGAGATVVEITSSGLLASGSDRAMKLGGSGAPAWSIFFGANPTGLVQGVLSMDFAASTAAMVTLGGGGSSGQIQLLLASDNRIGYRLAATGNTWHYFNQTWSKNAEQTLEVTFDVSTRSFSGKINGVPLTQGAATGFGFAKEVLASIGNVNLTYSTAGTTFWVDNLTLDSVPAKTLVDVNFDSAAVGVYSNLAIYPAVMFGASGGTDQTVVEITNSGLLAGGSDRAMKLGGPGAPAWSIIFGDSPTWLEQGVFSMDFAASTAGMVTLGGSGSAGQIHLLLASNDRIGYRLAATGNTWHYFDQTWTKNAGQTLEVTFDVSTRSFRGKINGLALTQGATTGFGFAKTNLASIGNVNLTYYTEGTTFWVDNLKLSAVPAEINAGRIWQNRKQDLINWIHSGFTSSPVNPYILYNVQLYTGNILWDAARRGNISQLDDLSEVYLAAYDYLEIKTNYVYYYWPGEASESIHNLETPARMWLDDPSKTSNGVLGVESTLVSGQFLYGVAYLIDAICNIPSAQRTDAMTSLVNQYTPVILSDHYHRWIFANQGIFQRRGWGTSIGLYNHQEHLGRLLNREYAGTASFVNAVTDTDLWIIAGVTEMLSAHAKEPLLVPMTGSTKTNLLDYVALGVELIASRLSVSTLTNFQGQAAAGIQFDLGEWDDHSTYQYAGYTGALSPLGQGWAPMPADNIGWDISHARRFVNVFETLYRNRVVTGMSFPSRTLMEGLAAQLIYGAFNKDLDAPRFSNFMDGQNGWFRVGYSAGFPGYRPYGMCTAFTTGGFGFWDEFNPDIAAVSRTLADKIGALYTRDLSGNGRGCIAAGSVWQSDTGNGSAGCMEFLGDGSSFVNGGSWPEYASSTGTLEFWLKPEASGGNRDLVKIFEDSASNYFLIQKGTDDRIGVFIRNNNAWVLSRRTVATIPNGVWTHFAVTQDGGGAKIYINGIEAPATGTNSGAWTDSFFIGGAWFAKGHSSAQAFYGAMDDIRVYNRALTAPEIVQDMAGQVSHSGNMVLRWEFDDIPNYSDIDFIMENYPAEYDLSSSLDLLMFLPAATPF